MRMTGRKRTISNNEMLALIKENETKEISSPADGRTDEIIRKNIQ